MTERTDQWDESMCGIWRVKPEEKKMTEQERFEQEAAKHFIAENLTGSAFLKDRFGEYMHPQINWGWHCWQAAQQKEGYVLVPVEQAKDTQRIDWLADVNNKIGNVQLPTACVEKNPHSLRAAIDAAMISAAREAE